MNILKLKKTIVKFLYAIMLLLLFVGNVDVHAGNKGGAIPKNEKVKINDDDKDPNHDPERDIQFPGPGITRENYLNKKNVIDQTGGGGSSGSGGGAKKNSGSTAGGNTTLADSGKSTRKNVSTAEEQDNRDAAINETMGFAKDEGEYHAEREGSHAGKKVFEIDRNGNLGMNDKLGILDARGLFGFALFLAFGVGAAAFLLASRDVRKKNNYF